MKVLLSCCLLLSIVVTQAQQHDSTTHKVKHHILFPFLVHSPEYNWGAGAAGIYYFKTGSAARTSNIKAVSFATLRKQMVFASEGNIFLSNEKYIIHYTASASHFPDRFWGLGNNSLAENLERYTISQFDLYPQIIRNIYADFFIGVGYEFQNVFNFQYVSNNGQSIFDTENIIGRNGGKVSGGGLILTWDSRNNSFSPDKGLLVQFFINAYHKVLGSDFNFVIQNLDIRKFVALRSAQVLAFQFNLISTFGNVPIRDYPNIGSNSYMRGYYEGRYQDNKLAAIQAEWRAPVYKRLGIVIFSGCGKVGSSFNEVFSIRNLKPTIGAGLRVALSKAEKLNLRMDAGFGNKSHGTYVNMGEAF
jgi:hypothetical protein